MQNLITDHLDIWTAAHKTRSIAGRGSNNKLNLHGIKKLRELILELAVRGKLVPQDPSDEPASELLKKIAVEKAKLIEEGKIKKEKPLPTISEDEKHFELPLGWEFIRLGELTSKLGSGSTPRGGQAAYQETGIIFLRSQNVWNDGLKLDDTAYISDETHRAMDGTHVFPNDILLNITGASLGRTTIFPAELKVANVSQHVTIVRLVEPQMVKFVHLGIMSPMVQHLVWGRQVGMAIEGLSKKVLEQFEFPIPPLAEQHRIVAKVDELMAFCDQLEQTQSDTIAAHAQLVEALLATLTNSSDHFELQNNWQRIAAHFDTLFTTEHSIDQLKQTILQLAVKGKLVPQNPNDEPVDNLYGRIKSNELIRIKNKEIQKPKSVLESDAPDIKIPSSWRYFQMGSLAFVTKLAGFEYTEHMSIVLGDDGEIPVIRAQNVRPFKPDLRNLKYIDLNTSTKLQRCALDKPCLLMTFIGAGIGDTCIFNEENRWHLAPNVAKLEPFADICLDFLVLYLNSDCGRFEIFKSMKSTAQPSLSMTTIREIWLPIPPLPEQYRIAKKVDELMILCDTLKTNIQNAQTTQLALADALVERAVG